MDEKSKNYKIPGFVAGKLSCAKNEKKCGLRAKRNTIEEAGD